jgi:hypothetical protein
MQKQSIFISACNLGSSTEESIMIKPIELGTKQQRGIRKKAHNPEKASS